jgi:putative transcriptional regulator
MSDERGGPELLRSKRAATRYRVLVEIARRQPAVSQREIADTVGVTAQAVSEHLGDLADSGYVDRQARGRYEVTVEGVDWLISQTDALETYVGHVSEDVIGDVEVDTAVAADGIDEGERVALSMTDGVLTATPLSAGGSGDDSGSADDTGETGDTPSSATALAVTDADAGRDVAVAEFDGVLDYELGTVTVVEVPSVQAGGSRAVDSETLRGCAGDADLVAAAGTEALTALRQANVEPDQRFGTAEAVEEAATKGLDVLLVAVTDRVSTHTDRLRDSAVGYEVVDAL